MRTNTGKRDEDFELRLMCRLVVAGRVLRTLGLCNMASLLAFCQKNLVGKSSVKWYTTSCTLSEFELLFFDRFLGLYFCLSGEPTTGASYAATDGPELISSAVVVDSWAAEKGTHWSLFPSFRFKLFGLLCEV